MKTRLLLFVFTTMLPLYTWADVQINETNFPDAAFRSYLKAQGYGADGVITDAEISSVRSITVESRGIYSLKGIENFTALTLLRCELNNLTTLDVSKNTALVNLSCNGNQLTTLNVSGCSKLNSLLCYENKLEVLSVSGLTKLETLYCFGNQLGMLEVSGCTALTSLQCNNNRLTALDVSGCASLNDLRVYSNYIKDAAMDDLLSSMPHGYFGTLCIIDTNDSNEGNVCTTTQVTAINDEGWTAYKLSPWQPYEGTAPDLSNAEAFAVLSSDGKTVRFYYNHQKDILGGVEIQATYGAKSYGSAKTVYICPSFRDYRPTSTAYWFQFCKMNIIIGMKNLNVDNVTDMHGMFSECSSLKSLDLSHFNTSNVTDMSALFNGCNSLSSLDISSFNTAKVTAMNGMFLSCRSLVSLNLSHFNTANVNNMRYMFDDCRNLRNLDVSQFNTSKVTNMEAMFISCYALTGLDLHSFNTENVVEMRNMFNNCSSLTILDLASFNTKKVNNIYRMFYGCSQLKRILVDSEKWSTESLTNLGNARSAGASTRVQVLVEEPQNGGTDVFKNCISLIGGSGTAYDENHIDYTYARIDGGAGNPGYLTATVSPIRKNKTAKASDFADNSLTNKTVDNVYFNLDGDGSGYDSSDQSLVISQSTDMSQIANATPGSDDVANDFTGLILKVSDGNGTVTVSTRTDGTAVLAVQIGNNEPTTAQSPEKSDITVDYNVSEDTYVYIYSVDGSSNARTRSASGNQVRIYGINVSVTIPGDVNGDGDVNGEDVEAVANYIMDQQSAGTFDEKAADVNGDGKVDAADIVEIVNIIKAGQ